MAQPLHEQKNDVREMLVNTARKDLNSLASRAQGKMYFGLDLISSYFSDDDGSIRSKAAEVYILRTYRGYTVHDVEVIESKDVVDKTPAALLHTVWKYSPPGVQGTMKLGYLVLVPDADSLTPLQMSWVMPSATEISEIEIVVA